MSPKNFFKSLEHPYSLIVDLLGETEPLGVTMSLDLGDVINRMDKEYICIGSGEILGDIKNHKLEEIRAYIVRKDDLNTVRKILQKFYKEKSTFKPGMEITLKGSIDNKKVRNGDILFKFYSTFKGSKVRIRINNKNLKFVKGLDIEKRESYEGRSVFVHGPLIFKDWANLELQARALITAGLDYGIKKFLKL